MFGPSLLISVLPMCHLCDDLELGLLATRTDSECSAAATDPFMTNQLP